MELGKTPRRLRAARGEREFSETQLGNSSDRAAARSCTQRPTESWMLNVDSTFAGSSTGVLEYAYANPTCADPSRFVGLPSKSSHDENPFARVVTLKCVALVLLPFSSSRVPPS